MGMHALGLEFGSAAQLSKRSGSVWNCLENALKRSPGIFRKSRVLYPGPGFLSSATWPSLPKKHYNGLNQTKESAPYPGSHEHSCFPFVKLQPTIFPLCKHIIRFHELPAETVQRILQ